MRIVMYREGIHRRRYHADGRCPALLMHPEEHKDWAACPEEVAQTTHELLPCKKCVKAPEWYVEAPAPEAAPEPTAL
ncbi:hypothetical protein [Yinghuangia sp. YIM S09857]|uniref:hypothetical protein n=1 Tax=Yinghuangia sp. YIM S09857 TaxID=3436929 RepID=UPI003F53197C